MSRKFLFSLFSVLLLIVPFVFGVLPEYDDFEDDVVGAVPNGWFEANPGKTRIRTSNTAGEFYGGSKGARGYNAVSDGSAPAVYRGITAITANCVNNITFYWKALEISVSRQYTYIIVHDSTDHAAEGIFLAIRNDGVFYAYSGGVWVSIAPYSVGVWYRVTLFNINLTSDKYNVLFLGTIYGYPFAAVQASLNYFNFECAGVAGYQSKMALDDFVHDTQDVGLSEGDLSDYFLFGVVLVCVVGFGFGLVFLRRKPKFSSFL